MSNEDINKEQLLIKIQNREQYIKEIQCLIYYEFKVIERELDRLDSKRDTIKASIQKIKDAFDIPE